MILTRKRILAAKLEAVVGTAEAPAGADATNRVFDMALKYNIPWNRMPQQGSLSKGLGVPGTRAGELTFYHYLTGKGTAGVPTWATVFLAACGWVNSTGTYKPVSNSQVTLTASLYQDGRLKKIAGAMGTFKINGQTGNPAKVSYTFTGKHVAPSSASLLAPTYDAVQPPRCAAATITVGGTTYKIKEWELDAGNEVVLIPDQNDSSGTGFFAALVTSRDNAKLTVKLAAPLLSTHDFYADHAAGTAAAFSCAIGSAANNTMTLAAPQLQLSEPPADEDDNGYLLDSLTFEPAANSSAGDDEVSLAFS